jgi:hypothetical protein
MIQNLMSGAWRRALRFGAAPALLALTILACDDTLTVEPVNELPAETAISDSRTAYAALAGAYDALQDDASTDYMAGSFVAFGDLPSDDVVHSGTFDTFLEADLNDLLADNSTIEAIWAAIYDGIAIVNRIIERVPELDNISQDEQDDILGQSYFLRALHYHNLVKHWGGVPLILTPPAGPSEARQITRATVDEVYAQIYSDLNEARGRLQEERNRTRASISAVYALRTRVNLFDENWAAVVANADSLEDIADPPSLVVNYSSLWTTSTTDEDILRVEYTPEEAHFLGWWYRAKGAFGGRYEIAPSCALAQAFDADVNCAIAAPYATFNPTDQRAQATITKNGDTEIFGSKWPSGVGNEGVHVIRFAEVILNKAEALARLNSLPAAVTELNRIRARAGVPPFVYVAGVTTQQQVLDAIWHERRLELAFEGHRFVDLVRTGRAVAVLDIDDRPHQVLFPIPQQEIDVTEPPLSQNPGY